MKVIDVATPFSDLFSDPADRRAILAATDVVEIRHPHQVGMLDSRMIFHCDLSLVVPWGADDLETLGQVAESSTLEAVSFHVLSRYMRNELVDGMFHGIDQPMNEETMFKNANNNVSSVREILHENVSIMLENNNHLGPDAYDVVTDPCFLKELVEQHHIGLLLDVAHARITAHNTGCSLEEYLTGLPFGRCEQVHLSRHGVTAGGRAVDAHEALEAEDWALFESLIAASLPRVRYATLEYYKDCNGLLQQLERLRGILKPPSGKGQRA